MIWRFCPPQVANTRETTFYAEGEWIEYHAVFFNRELKVMEVTDMARERWLCHSASKWVMTHIRMSRLTHTDESWPWLTWRGSAGSATLCLQGITHSCVPQKSPVFNRQSPMKESLEQSWRFLIFWKSWRGLTCCASAGYATLPPSEWCHIYGWVMSRTLTSHEGGWHGARALALPLSAFKEWLIYVFLKRAPYLIERALWKSWKVIEVPNIVTVMERTDMARERWLCHSASKYVMPHILLSHVTHTNESWRWLTWHASAGSAPLPPDELCHIY